MLYYSILCYVIIYYIILCYMIRLYYVIYASSHFEPGAFSSGRRNGKEKYAGIYGNILTTAMKILY